MPEMQLEPVRTSMSDKRNYRVSPILLIATIFILSVVIRGMTTPTVVDEVLATRLTVLDPAGRPAITIGISDNSSNVCEILDPSGNPRITIKGIEYDHDKFGGGVVVHRADGSGFAGMGCDSTGAGLVFTTRPDGTDCFRLNSYDGGGNLMLSDSKGITQVEITGRQMGDGGSLYLRDRYGSVLVRAGADLQGDGYFETRDSEGRRLLEVSSSKDSPVGECGYVLCFDSLGKLEGSLP